MSTIPELVALFAVLLVVAVGCEPLAKRWRVPVAGLLVIAGFVGSEIVTWAGIDTGLRAANFQQLVLYVLLPPLIFNSAVRLDARQFIRHLFPIVLLAAPMLILCSIVCAYVLFYGINHPAGFPWVVALLTGVLLSAIDPAAVLQALPSSAISQRIKLLMEGESLLNDGVAIVLFSVLLSLALAPSADLMAEQAVQRFLWVFIGGVCVGGLTILLVWWWLPKIHTAAVLSTLMLALTYATYVAAEALHVSGVMAVLTAGLLVGYRLDTNAQPDEFEWQAQWAWLAYVMGAVMFILAGMTITPLMFTERWLAMLLGIGAVLLARAAGLLVFVPLLQVLPGGVRFARQDYGILYLGGVRGAVTLALALSLPLELEAWFTVQSVAYAVVLFGLLVQVPLIRGWVK